MFLALFDGEWWRVEKGIERLAIFIQDCESCQGGAVVNADDGAVSAGLAGGGNGQRMNLHDDVAGLPIPGGGVEGISLAENGAVWCENLGEEDGTWCI